MKIALIGLGYWGPNLLRTLHDLNVLVAAFDSDKTKIDKFSSEISYKNIFFGTDWECALGRADVSGIVIATPPSTHYTMAMRALECGKHVFIEKPMTLNLNEAKEINNLAAKKNLKVLVGHIFLYSPEILKLKDIVWSEEFGKIQYMYTRRLNLGKIQSPATVIDDLAPHDISIFDFILGCSCQSAQVTAKAHVLNTPDVAFVNLMYDDVLCHMHLSWLDPLKVRDTVVVGTKQMVVCDSMNKRITLYNKGVDLDIIEDNMTSFGSHLLSYRYGDEISPYIQVVEPMKSECKDFINCIATGKSPTADGALGERVVEVLECMRMSLERGGEWVKI